MNPETHQDMSDEERTEAVKALRAMAEILDNILNGKGTPQRDKVMGFALLVFPIDQIDAGHINYVGNGKRGDVHVAIKELAARWEGRVQETESRQ